MKRALGILLLLAGVELSCAQSAPPAGGSASPPVQADIIRTNVPPAGLPRAGLPPAGLPRAGLPRLILPHTALPVLTDSAYLISTARYRFYRQLHRLALDTTAQAGDLLIGSYARSLRETQHAYDTLLMHYQATDLLATQTLYGTQLSLAQLSRSLNQTQYALAQTAHHLEEAKDEARVARRRSLVQRLAYGAGGIGVGLVLGLLLR
jgi:hypothetical protein